MAVNPLYVVQSSLEEFFINSTTGLPLAGGLVYFYSDNNRTEPKTVYELSGAPPNYTYTPLPNPMTLSAVGTTQDALNNNVVIYYYPYDDFGNLDTYYVVVTDALGNEMFTRENWPFPNVGNGMGPFGVIGTSPPNEISNSQFVSVFFNDSVGTTLTFSGSGTTNVLIAPDWNLQIQHTGAGTVNVNRIAVAGSSKYQSNPPYLLNIIPGGAISGLMLQQQLTNNPDIWSPTQLDAGIPLAGFIASSIMLSPTTSLTMQYAPSNGTAQTLMTANNGSGLYQVFNNTTQLVPGDNTDLSTVGYVNINLILSPSNPSTFSSVQVVGLEENIIGVPYEQQPVKRQFDFLSHYFNPRLAYKPIPSYLVGWDFPLNPSLANGDTIAASGGYGDNMSFYTWDQTILFQSKNNGVSVSRGTSGCFTMTAQQDGQVAMIQYLDAPTAKKIIQDRISVRLSAYTSRSAGLAGKVTLWAMTSTLPNVATGTNLSIVATLDATGRPATFNGTWTEITRNGLGDAYFDLQQASSTNAESFDIMLNQWDLMGAVPANTATFFAIVVGFAPWVINDTISVNSISCCAGDIASRPAPKTPGETTLACNQYYFKTFENATVPAQSAGLKTGELTFIVVSNAGATASTNCVELPFPVPMRVNPTSANVTLYNPHAANALARNETTDANDATTTAVYSVSTKSVVVSMTGSTAGGQNVGQIFGVHITADARLGII